MIRSPLLVAIASGGRLNDRRSRSVDESRRGTGRTGNRAHATRDERGCPGLPCRKPEAKPVNDKSETIGRINDLIFGKDGNICAVPAVDDFTGLGGQLVAIPYRSLKLDDSSGYIVLPGASRSALCVPKTAGFRQQSLAPRTPSRQAISSSAGSRRPISQ